MADPLDLPAALAALQKDFPEEIARASIAPMNRFEQMLYPETERGNTILGRRVRLRMPALQSQQELVDTLAHELTHVRQSPNLLSFVLDTLPESLKRHTAPPGSYTPPGYDESYAWNPQEREGFLAEENLHRRAGLPPPSGSLFTPPNVHPVQRRRP